MKYIMMEIPFGTMVRKAPVLFPDFLTHAIVAEAIQAHPLMSSAKVVSAGEFSSTDLLEIDLHGKSTSLGLASNPMDSAIVGTLDYTHGIMP